MANLKPVNGNNPGVTASQLSNFTSNYKALTGGGSSSKKNNYSANGGVDPNNPNSPLATPDSVSSFLNTLNSQGILNPGVNLTGLKSTISKSLTSNTPIDIEDLKKYNGSSISVPPVLPTPNLNYNGLLASTGKYDAQGQPIIQSPTDTSKTDLATLSDTIKSTLGPEPTRIDRQKIEKQAGVTEFAQQARDLESEIARIKANTETAKIALIGQGRGVPEVIIGGQQAQLDREAAMQLIPLTAQYQAVSGNLNAAKEQVNAFIADENAYQDRVYRYYQDLGSRTWDYMTMTQKRQWEIQDQGYQLQRDQIQFNNNLKADAWNKLVDIGAFTTGGKVLSLDPKAQDFSTRLGDLMNAAGSTTSTTSNPVIATILGSGKFTKDQVKLITNAINNGEDPATVIKNQAKNLMGQTEATTLTKYEVARDQMSSISDLLNQYYTQGGKTGIFSGNYEKVLNNLGTLNDPKLVGIATQISAALQIYRNAVSGTAYSVQEGKDIASIFPGINKNQGLNNAIINGRLTAFDTTIDSTYRTTLGSAYDSIKPQRNYEQAPVETTPAEDEIYNKVVGNTGGGSWWSNFIKGLSGK